MSQVERLARNGLRMEGAPGENGELLSLRDHEDDGGGGGGGMHGGGGGGAGGSGAHGYHDDDGDDDVRFEDGKGEKRRRSRNLGGHNDSCCEKILKCLGLIPCPSLLSWILLLLGIGCLTGGLLVATWRTRDLLNDDDLLWFMEYSIIGVVVGMFVVATLILISSHLSSEPTSRRVFNSFSKNRCAQGLNIFALVMSYILTIAWTLLTAILATPLVFIVNLYIVDPDPLDLSVYGFSGKYTGNELTEFKEKTENLLISYAVAFFAAIVIVNSLVCFIICISSNIAHLRDNRFATLNAYGAEEVRNSKHSVLDTNM